MLFNSMLPIFTLLRKTTTGNPLIKVNSEDVFFAFTGKAVEDVVLNKYSSFQKDGGFKRLKSVIGEGLLTSEEPRHMNNKKEIYPAFGNSRIKEYEYKISETTDTILSSWSQEVNVRKEMKFLVFKSVMKIFFSENMDSDFETMNDNMSIASDRIAFDVNDSEMHRSAKELKEFSKR